MKTNKTKTKKKVKLENIFYDIFSFLQTYHTGVQTEKTPKKEKKEKLNFGKEMEMSLVEQSGSLSWLWCGVQGVESVCDVFWEDTDGNTSLNEGTSSRFTC